MFKKCLSLFLIGLFSTFLLAKTPELRPNAPEKYVVEKGDTLWDIADMYLEKPWDWPFLWRQNPTIKNPDLIYPGDSLHLLWQEDKPILRHISKTIDDSSLSKAPYSPISSMDLSILKDYLTFDKLIDEGLVATLPRVLGSQEGRSYISARDPFYIDTPLQETFWSVYRLGPLFERKKDNGTEKMVGLVKVADAKLNRTLDRLSEMKLIKQYQEVRPNDLVLPQRDDTKGRILSISPAPKGVKGQVIGHFDSTKYIRLKQVVVVNLGRFDGLRPGHVLLVTEKGESLGGQKGQMAYLKSGFMKSKFGAADLSHNKLYQLPVKEVASLLVIKTYPHFSLAMVVRAKLPFAAPMRVIGAN